MTPGTLSRDSPGTSARIAVLIPCLNEEITVGKVIRDFKRVLSNAVIFVFDNNSTDRTVEIAEENGARVIREPKPGKGKVIQAMFRKIDADYYLMVDGDDTYSADHALELLQPLMDGHAEMLAT